MRTPFGSRSPQVLSADAVDFVQHLLQRTTCEPKGLARAVHDSGVALGLMIPLAEAPEAVVVLDHEHRPAGSFSESVGQRLWHSEAPKRGQLQATAEQAVARTHAIEALLIAKDFERPLLDGHDEQSPSAAK